MVVLDPKVDTTLQVSFAKPGTAPLPASINPLAQCHGSGRIVAPSAPLATSKAQPWRIVIDKQNEHQRI
jgi:hypothetical protein